MSAISVVQAEDNWSRFRGPNANGVVADSDALPETWSKTENVKWTADVPGWGWACPVVWGNKVFVTTVVPEEKGVTPSKGLYLGQGVRDPAKGIHHWMVYCFDLNTGDELWKHEAHVGKPKIPRHPKSTYASETPTTDGKRLYVLFGDLGLYCYDLDGQPLWKHDIEPKKTFFDYGAAASPVVHEDKVYFIYDNQVSSYLMALNAENGEQVWKKERPEKSTWATPFLWKHEGRTELVTCGKNKNRSYDLDGNLLWEFDGRMSNLVIPSPFVADGLLYLTSGYFADRRRPVWAIKPGASGDISLKEEETSNEFIQWFLPRSGPYNTSPIVYKDLYYTLYDRGFLTLHDAKTGEEIFGKRRFAPGASFTASPWAYNGKVFFLSEEGQTFVIEANKEYKLLHTNSLEEMCISTPAISQGNLLIRTASKLYCISKK